MPELPEVETIRRQLAAKIIGKKLNGQKIINVRRRAKILFIDLANGSSLIFHLKLTGQLIFNAKPSVYTRKVFVFDDGSKLVFNDVRRFGWWKEMKDTSKLEKEFGPEALEVDLKTFSQLLKKKPKSKIKPLLMDQKFIAGIGNIYSDEILFAAGVLPWRLVKTLTEDKIKKIHQNIKKVLTKALQYRGTTEQYYRDACGQPGDYNQQLKVYQRGGQPCLICGAKIKRVKIAGRSAHYCPHCQK
ncbi:MAG: DNA-formamidopyrimidine glycosylase [Minisyncoccales bacterium]